MTPTKNTTAPMPAVTVSSIPGRETSENIGIVFGSSVRSRNFIFDIFAAFKNLFGGEVRSYTRLLEDAQSEATSRMLEQAKKLEADAVVDVHFATSQVAYKAAEIFAYGTAVRLK
ncbi:YbjQ family protein [Thalassospira lucentensis]|uniref:YbjQ family protein n=1 Tax=Thalassospira lucentensis TaxID=168935 RepID=UPI00142E57A4|nr:YbjQ family protein [Thalassospira lucentensis]NIZ01454.1 YbjQ family protein [Thalassospira lucentensis]